MKKDKKLSVDHMESNVDMCLDKDQITGLLSVNSFFYEGTKWMEENPDVDFDIVAIDVRGFSAINDAKGQEGADQILKKMADFMRDHQKNVRFMATRVYADRFALLVRRRENYKPYILMKANEITKRFEGTINVHFRVGIYEIIDHNMPLSTACSRAFSATNLIKDGFETKCVYYDEEVHKKVLFEEKVNDEMVEALKKGQFQVYYQPKYDIFTNSISGAEALVRWIHPVDGMISPVKFIPIFEKNRFIVELDQYIWKTTVEQISEWHKTGYKVVPISVNISRMDIESIDVVKVLCDIMEENHVLPELLHLEITESAYIQDTNEIIRVVKNLQNKGFIIEMDDFGSGYSSLNMLAKLPVNVLKMDMKFIQGIEDSMNARTIIEYTIGLAKWMNIPVVAEGVETQEQLDLLRQLECNYVQGYIFARPMPKQNFEKQLQMSQEDLVSIEGREDGITIFSKDHKHTIMIVEDLEMNRSIIRSMFDKTFNIVEAPDGSVAWNYLESGAKLDLVIMDVYMPHMDGYELMGLMKSKESYTNIPILVISSETDKNEIKRLYEMGANEFLSKPFTPEIVTEKIRSIMRQYDLNDEIELWDIKEFSRNPIVKDMCADMFFVDIKDDIVCTVLGDRMAPVTKKIEDVLDRDLYLMSKEKSGKYTTSFVVTCEERYIIKAKKIMIEGKSYLLFYKINTGKDF